MAITLDHLAQRYHCLPSAAMTQGSSFDLYIMDVATKYQQRLRDQAEGKIPHEDISEDEMHRMLAAARSKDGH